MAKSQKNKANQTNENSREKIRIGKNGPNIQIE